MKPSSLRLIISKVVKTCLAGRQAKGHEYINSSNKSFGDEGYSLMLMRVLKLSSPNTFENYLYCEVTTGTKWSLMSILIRIKTTKLNAIFINNCITNF